MSKDWKAKLFKSFGSMKTKGPKQDSPTRLRSPMSDGGEPYEFKGPVLFYIHLVIEVNDPEH
jgi:hypothetical protein